MTFIRLTSFGSHCRHNIISRRQWHRWLGVFRRLLHWILSVSRSCPLIALSANWPCRPHTYTHTPTLTHRCNSTTQCVEQRKNCDGSSDCDDSSDEWNCDDSVDSLYWDHLFRKRPAAVSDDLPLGSCGKGWCSRRWSANSLALFSVATFEQHMLLSRQWAALSKQGLCDVAIGFTRNGNLPAVSCRMMSEIRRKLIAILLLPPPQRPHWQPISSADADILQQISRSEDLVRRPWPNVHLKSSPFWQQN